MAINRLLRVSAYAEDCTSTVRPITISNYELQIELFSRVYTLSYEYGIEMFEFINEYGLEGEIIC